MEAGSDTTASVLLTFILAMASHPEVLKKAQEELDSVCGPDRSPNWDDCKQLTYMPAIINEVSLYCVLERRRDVNTLVGLTMATDISIRCSTCPHPRRHV